MDNKIDVKEYSNDFQNQVIDLIIPIQQEEYHIPITPNDQPDLFNIETFYQKDKGNFWVATYNDQVVGTIAFLDIGNAQVALRKMFVEQNYRGKIFNTASLLLHTAFDWAKEHSIEEIFLGTTLQFLAAHRFYEKNGFLEISMEDLPENFPILQVDKKFYNYCV